MLAQDLDYVLPEELIAQEPLPERDGARLLVVDRKSGHLAHRQVRKLSGFLPPSLWVVNNTRVFPARLRGAKSTGGRIELLLLERRGEPGNTETWRCMGRGLTAGNSLTFAEGLTGKVVRKEVQGTYEVALVAPDNVTSLLYRTGEVPLPPYIRRSPSASDDERYQTVFAEHLGAVAAPTAGLHLSRRLLSELRAAGHQIAAITLHVGPGTFQPLRSDALATHVMHGERFVIDPSVAETLTQAKQEGRKVVAVGTTVVRALESAADAQGRVHATQGVTDLFIYPPFSFRAVDALLTNFHLPRSTLLALVMAFGGVATIRQAYAEAVKQRYRFYSYGDAMLIGDDL